MATQLETNLQAILTEKTEKILPENIRQGVTVFGVEGALKELSPKDTLQSISGDVTVCYDTTKDIALREDWRRNQLLVSEVKNTLQYAKIREYDGEGVTAFKIDYTCDGYISIDGKYSLKVDNSAYTITVSDIETNVVYRTYSFAEGALGTATLRIIPGYVIVFIRTGTGIYTIYKFGIEEDIQTSVTVEYIPTYSASGYSNTFGMLSYYQEINSIPLLTTHWTSETIAKVRILLLNIETMIVTELYTEDVEIDSGKASNVKTNIALDNNKNILYYRTRRISDVLYATIKTISLDTGEIISETGEKEISAVTSLGNPAKVYATCVVYHTDDLLYWANHIIDKNTFTITTNTTTPYPFNQNYEMTYAFSNVYEGQIGIYDLVNDTSKKTAIPNTIYYALDAETCGSVVFTPVPVIIDEKLRFGTFNGTTAGSSIMDLVSLTYCSANEASHMLISSAASSTEYLNQYAFANMSATNMAFTDHKEYIISENLASMIATGVSTIDGPYITTNLNVTNNDEIQLDGNNLIIGG